MPDRANLVRSASKSRPAATGSLRGVVIRKSDVMTQLGRWPTNPRNTLAIENAQRYPPKLIVPRWAQAKHPKTGGVGEGLLAPYPDLPGMLAGLKGSFCCMRQRLPA